MKQKIVGRTLLAAMLAVTAIGAYGQVNATTAKIPFSFRAAGSDFPAGRYRVVQAAGAMTMELQDVGTGKSLFIGAKAHVTETGDARPRLIFRCGGEEGCALAKLWSGSGVGLEFHTPPLTPSQRERRETIYLDRFKEK
jgi:hypothetical protein